MVKFKIFNGSFQKSCKSADEYANEWIEKHPEISILHMKYQQARYGDHSICIMYEEKPNGGN